jgi:hypothetical protein
LRWRRGTACASAALVGLGLALAACDKLRPGYCEKAEHCPDGQLCDLEGRVAFRQCVSMDDGGTADRPARPGVPSPSGEDAYPPPGEGSDGGETPPPDAPVGCSAGATCPAATPLCVDDRCVECAEDAQCTDPLRRFCVAGSCADCRTAGPTACKAPTAVCDPASGSCVQCVANSSCTDPRAPFCGGNRCVGCGMAAPQTCTMLNAARPACSADGACVECNVSADCSAEATRPICVDRACVACTADAQCAARQANPGVCRRDLGGRCATEAETIYVQDGAGCGAAGTAAMPLCSMDAALPLLTATRNLVVVRGVVGGFVWNNPPAGTRATIVGQSGAVFAGGVRSGIRLSGGGDVTVRGVTVRSSEVAGIVAERGATLRLETVLVDTNRGGGILLDGARFEIRDTLVTNNGPGDAGLVVWGGILIRGTPAGDPALLERVSLLNNRQIGLTCDAAVQARGLLARGNAGGVEVGSTCNVTPCPAESATCGSSVKSPPP